MSTGKAALPKSDALPSSSWGGRGAEDDPEKEAGVLSLTSATFELTTSGSDLRDRPRLDNFRSNIGSQNGGGGEGAERPRSSVSPTENSCVRSVYNPGGEHQSMRMPDVVQSREGSFTIVTSSTRGSSSFNAGFDASSLIAIGNAQCSSNIRSITSDSSQRTPSSLNIAQRFDAPIAMAIDRSAAVLPPCHRRPPQKFSSQSSGVPGGGGKSRPRNSTRTCSIRSSSLVENGSKVGEYLGMPKVDDDIEVGKKIVRRRKLSIAYPPSSNHMDVQAPALYLVQRALNAHKAAGARTLKRPQGRAEGTEFHDEKGHMLLPGSREGQYVGDVLGGLPHGHGQHWIAKRCPPCGGSSGDRHMLYEGAWEYGTKSGFGRMLYTNGQQYRGYFKSGERHGRGVMQYEDGSIYDGEWVKSRKHGLGSCYYGDGGIFKGMYNKDNRDGWGNYYWPNKCRKFEGEWVGDDPVCGNATNIREEEYNTLIETIPEWCEVKSRLPHPLPGENLELPVQTLRNPELAYYPRACARRQYRIDEKTAVLKEVPNPKIVVQHKGSLTPRQMQGLRLAFDKLSLGYCRRTMVNRIQLRRLILLARLDPDSEMGNNLFVKLLEATSQTVGLTYNNFMKAILSFQHPALFELANSK